jgi:hypothetical protein
MVESSWFGMRFEMFIEAVKNTIGDDIKKATETKSNGPLSSVPYDKDKTRQIESLHRQFAKDSRRFLNPIANNWMKIRDSRALKRLFKVNKYAS